MGPGSLPACARPAVPDRLRGVLGRLLPLCLVQARCSAAPGAAGCVNTVHFSPDGQLLVSGSDDMQIFFWDWQLGTRTLAFHSGHHNNVFQARIMPHSANSTVVTCAADGLVRVATVQQGSGGAAVGTRRLACHRGRAHKLALEPGSPHCFLSCGEFRLQQQAGISAPTCLAPALLRTKPQVLLGNPP